MALTPLTRLTRNPRPHRRSARKRRRSPSREKLVSRHNLVLHEYRAIYFSIPKVACSTLKTVLANRIGFAFSDRKGNGIHRAELPALTHEEILSERYADYYRFCFVRNPWDRLVSCYRSKIAEPGKNTGRWRDGVAGALARHPQFRGGMSFESFVDAVCEIPDSVANGHFRSQVDFLPCAGGDLLVDEIGRFETLERDFHRVLERMGLEAARLPHINPSDRGHYREYYTPETWKRVAARYERDIEAFGYTFDA